MGLRLNDMKCGICGVLETEWHVITSCKRFDDARSITLAKLSENTFSFCLFINNVVTQSPVAVT